MDIFLIRHAESAANIKPFLYKSVLHHEIPLTRNGENQSRNLGNQLQKILEDEDYKQRDVYIYYSPYVRTFRTLELMLSTVPEELKSKFILKEDPILHEQMRGTSLESIATKSPGIYSTFWFREEDSESHADTYFRARSKYLELKLLHESNDIIILVSHQEFLKNFESILQNTKPSSAFEDYSFSNAEIKKFQEGIKTSWLKK